MRYIISYENPHHHYIDIELIIDNINQDELKVQLPSWRPGRYELGNFAKNIQKWKVLDEKGNVLYFEKETKDSWLIHSKNVNEVHIQYNYYASELNAGSTYLSEEQLYMNPVNCCLYVPERINEECLVDFQLPDDYVIASSIKKLNSHQLIAQNFDELADSPLIASNSLKHNAFVCNGITFNIWFQGECKPEWDKIMKDFSAFVKEHLNMMTRLPSDEYHFLIHILPYRYYHGVEHLKSTVIVLGPSYNLMKGELYEDLLGVSSHELFHSWNIKAIRPVEMMPYDYTKENYSRLGFVCEGVTTYYGDLLLFRSGVFTEFEYFKTVFERLQKHFDNFGRFNMSVAASSFDTWLDGYVSGVPNRKTSIYDEGCLTAFMTDMLIRKNTGNTKSLDDVMNMLYAEFAMKGKGYSEDDYKGVVEHIANSSFDDFFEKYIYGTASYEPLLKETLGYIGCELIAAPSKKYYERFYGLKVIENSGNPKVTAVYPNSIADIAGLSISDEIIAVNGFQIKNDFPEWCKYFTNESVELTIISKGINKKIVLLPSEEEYYKSYYISKLRNATKQQQENFVIWSKRKFDN